MPPTFWMITDRNKKDDGLGGDRAKLSFWVSDKPGLDDFNNWSSVTRKQFKDELIAAGSNFPLILDPEKQEAQKHVAFFIHGFNNDWKDAARRYESICNQMFSGDDGLGVCILFSWPSDGVALGYIPDRIEVRNCAPDLAEILGDFYDYLLMRQQQVIVELQKSNPDISSKVCKAKFSVIAHSMGNYLFQKSMQLLWTRKNQPLLLSLLNQGLMVAADVDNDLFKSGEATDKSDGDAIANLTYRITALYSGRDPVLGLSAGVKHFGKRRLGRSGIDRKYPLPDNVWDVDCSLLFKPDETDIHSGYFKEQQTIELMRKLLRGIDRKVLAAAGDAPPPLPDPVP
ncbi:MAG TPA: alpha/beta hydrolase [Blastocatellia bacterium]|nr:alpha/beta hydrolase [Blastocatellia bacterium]